MNMVYVVTWPTDGLVKVGWTGTVSRWRAFCNRGGWLVFLGEFADWHGAAELEELLHFIFLDRFKRPFVGNKAGAATYLGSKSAGYMEMYAADHDTVLALMADVAEHMPPSIRAWE